jgi:hypothetical protein
MTNLDLFLDLFPTKIFFKLKKQVSKRLESLAKDSNIFFLPRKSPKDSNPRTLVRRFDSPLIDTIEIQECLTGSGVKNSFYSRNRFSKSFGTV